MIFFGNRGKVVSGIEINDFECPSCGNSKFTSFGIIRYFHIYWIPFFPTSRKVGIECSHCKRTLVDKDISKNHYDEIKRQIFKKSNTIPFFTGLILLIVLFAIASYSTSNTLKQEEAYILSPALNDTYIVNFNKLSTENSKYKYGVLRIKSIHGNNIEFLISKLGYNKTKGPEKDIESGKANDASYYSEDIINFNIEQLETMRNDKTIYSITRE